MSALAQPVVFALRWRLAAWIARAWRRMGWRHVLAALLIEAVRDCINPLGGVFFPPVVPPTWDPVMNFITGFWIVGNLLMVFSVLVADEAFDDGVAPLRAYGVVVAFLVLSQPPLDRFVYSLLPLHGFDQFAGQDEGAAQLLWWHLVALYEAGFAMAIYAYWRVTQRSMRQAQAAETEQARSEQRVQSARLLALQSRVEPQLLFDTLGHVGALHGHDPSASDALLADLIALLRSMQPSPGVDNSTVEREFALVEAWLRVRRGAGRQGTPVHLQMSAESAQVGIAPMLVLPLLRSVLAVPAAASRSWSLTADVVKQHLMIRLASNDEGAPADVLGRVDLAALQERLARLFGELGRLVATSAPLSLTLDLPRLLEDPDDHRADR